MIPEPSDMGDREAKKVMAVVLVLFVANLIWYWVL